MAQDDPRPPICNEADADLDPGPLAGDPQHDASPDPEDLAALQRWEPEATPGSLVALFPNKWVRRVLLAAVPILTLFFGSGLILASLINVTHALQVFGTAAGPGAASPKALQDGRVEALLVSGQENALRVAIWNRRKKLHERHFTAELVLDGGPARVHRTLAHGVAGPGPALEARFRLPTLKPGRYHLEVRARLGDDPFLARLPARMVALPHRRQAVPIESARPAERPQAPRPDPDGVTVELLPSSGHRVTNELPERLTVRATRPDGSPALLSGELRLAEGRLLDAEKGQPVGRPFTTDALGLHSLLVVSRHPKLALALRYRVGSGPGLRTERLVRQRTFRLERRNAQALLQPEQLIVQPGAEFGVTIFTLSSSGYVYVDLYSGGIRYHSATLHVTGNRGRLRLPAPSTPGLFRVQATDDFSNPGTGTVTRTLFATPRASTVAARKAPDGGTAPGGALRALALAVQDELPVEDFRTQAHLGAILDHGSLDATGIDRRAAATYLLSRLDHLHHPTDWLCDTTAADARALQARKARLQHLLVGGLAFTALLLLAMVAPLIWVNLALTRRGAAEREALMAEFEATADEATLEAGLRARHDADGNELITDVRQVRTERLGMDRLRPILQIFLVTGIILLTIGAILILLLRLSWGWS